MTAKSRSKSAAADPALRSAATTTLAAAVAFRLVDENDVCNHNAKQGGGGGNDLALQGDDLWIERVCVYQISNNKWRRRRRPYAELRSYYRNNRTGHVFPDHPPRGASNILPAPAEERERAKLAQQALQEHLDSSCCHHRSVSSSSQLPSFAGSNSASTEKRSRSLSPSTRSPLLLRRLSTLFLKSSAQRVEQEAVNQVDDDDDDHSSRTQSSSTRSLW